MSYDSIERKLRRIKDLGFTKGRKCRGCDYYGGATPIYNNDGEIYGYELDCPRGFEICKNPLELSDELKAWIIPLKEGE